MLTLHTMSALGGIADAEFYEYTLVEDVELRFRRGAARGVERHLGSGAGGGAGATAVARRRG